MASHGVLVRQGHVVVAGEVDAGNRCWAEFSNYWGFQHAMLTPGRAIAMSTTAASRVKSEDGVLGTLQAATAVTLESGNIEWSSEGVSLHFPGLGPHPRDYT